MSCDNLFLFITVFHSYLNLFYKIQYLRLSDHQLQELIGQLLVHQRHKLRHYPINK
jgi:hypothetical protein